MSRINNVFILSWCGPQVRWVRSGSSSSADRLGRDVAGVPAAPRKSRRLASAAACSGLRKQPARAALHVGGRVRGTRDDSVAVCARSTRVPSWRGVSARLHITAPAARRTRGHQAGSASTSGCPRRAAGSRPPPAAAGACPAPVAVKKCARSGHTANGRRLIGGHHSPKCRNRPPPSTHGITPRTSAHQPAPQNSGSENPAACLPQV